MRKTILISPVFILITLALFSGKALPQEAKPQSAPAQETRPDVHD